METFLQNKRAREMKKLLPFLLLCFVATSVYAQAPALDEKIKQICNQAILDIYYDILAVKEKHPSLANFDENVMYENKSGLYAIVYQYEGEATGRNKTRYAFGVTIDKLEDKTFPPQDGYFDYTFPVLGLKFSGYQRRTPGASQYDAFPLIQKHGGPLSDLQQERLPLRLFLRSTKDTYQVREEIEFEVVLKNVSKRHMVVKSLGQETLYFLFNNQFWGTRPFGAIQGSESVILKAGQSLTARFKGEGFQVPREIEIYGVYRMGIQGVNPSAVLRLQIISN
jgi:hypothetical protein